MKTIFVLFCAASICFLGVRAQLTATQDLTMVQQDLGITHSFTEVTIFRSRVQISKIMDRISLQLIHSHIDSYAFIKNIGFNVTDEIDAVEVTDMNERCLDQLRNRWSLKVRR